MAISLPPYRHVMPSYQRSRSASRSDTRLSPRPAAASFIHLPCFAQCMHACCFNARVNCGNTVTRGGAFEFDAGGSV